MRGAIMREDEMTPKERYERMDRTIQFILNLQAQFYADVRKAEEEISRNNELARRNEEMPAKNGTSTNLKAAPSLAG